MYKVCIFDLDGTLTDTLESLTYSVNATLTELGLRKITMDQCRQFVGNGAKVLIEKALAASGDEELALLDRGLEVYKRIFGENCTYHVVPYDGIPELLETLREQGIKTAVLSNKPHNQTVDVVADIFGKEKFACIAGQREGISRKPDPAGVYEILESLGVKKEECLYIGDSEVDVETARRAGVTGVGVTWGFRSRDVLEKAGAVHIIDTPQELMKIMKNTCRMKEDL